MQHPTFIILGAHKAATTSLHSYLEQHECNWYFVQDLVSFEILRKVNSTLKRLKVLSQIKMCLQGSNKIHTHTHTPYNRCIEWRKRAGI